MSGVVGGRRGPDRRAGRGVYQGRGYGHSALHPLLGGNYRPWGSSASATLGVGPETLPHYSVVELQYLCWGRVGFIACSFVARSQCVIGCFRFFFTALVTTRLQLLLVGFWGVGGKGVGGKGVGGN